MAGDKELIQKFLDTLEAAGADFTNSFRSLSSLTLPSSSDHNESLQATEQELLNSCCSLQELVHSLSSSVDSSQLQFLMLLYNTQPQLLEQLGKGKDTIEREMTRQKKMRDLKQMTPEQKISSDREMINQWLKLYVHRLSHENINNKERVDMMNDNNPRFILRNYIAQNAIALAEKGDYSEVRRVLKILENPFSDEPMDEVGVPDTAASVGQASAADEIPAGHCKAYDSKPPPWACAIRVS